MGFGRVRVTVEKSRASKRGQVFQRWKDEELNKCQGICKHRKVNVVSILKVKGSLEPCGLLFFWPLERAGKGMRLVRQDQSIGMVLGTELESEQRESWVRLRQSTVI